MADSYTYEVPAHRRGDTFRGFTVRISTDPVVDMAGVVAKIDWRTASSRSSPLGQSLSSAGDSPRLTVTEVDDGVVDVTILPHIPDLDPRKWYGQIQLVWPDLEDAFGDPLTDSWIDLTWVINDDTTN